MPIGNITQTMSTISPPPHRGVDVQTVFVNKQEDFQDHLVDITIEELNTLKDQLNLRIGEINSTATTMGGYATTASAGASTATTKEGEASTSATAALTSKNQASTFATNSSNSATKASQWADNNYNVAVETGKYSAKHWSVVAENVVVGTVKLTGNQTIADVKTFSSSPIVPTPTTTGDIITMDNIIQKTAVGIGYGTGAGGTVTQLTSKSTGVTLNKPTGVIIMNNAALAADASVYFNLTNGFISMYDSVYTSVIDDFGGTHDSQAIHTYDGYCKIKVKNTTLASRSEAIRITFAIIKGAYS